MAISTTIEVQPAALWPQGDVRDPLGVWGFRVGVTGDATGGSIKIVAQAPAGLRAAYVYTCYSLNCALLTGSLTGGTRLKVRLLTNWPNVDPIPGVQAYGSMLSANMNELNVTAPRGGLTDPVIGPADRFLLLFDPRPTGGVLELVELELADNVDAATYSFEGYGYWWDRSVLQAPGGLRHPGST